MSVMHLARIDAIDGRRRVGIVDINDLPARLSVTTGDVALQMVHGIVPDALFDVLLVGLMANYTGYAPGNKLAVDDPKLLKDYYAQRPNFATGVNQLSKMTGWYSWAGQNSVKIVDVMQNHINSVVAGRSSAKGTMPQIVADVQKLLPSTCQ